jgi:hypothetical protein
MQNTECKMQNGETTPTEMRPDLHSAIAPSFTATPPVWRNEIVANTARTHRQTGANPAKNPANSGLAPSQRVRKSARLCHERARIRHDRTTFRQIRPAFAIRRRFRPPGDSPQAVSRQNLAPQAAVSGDLPLRISRRSTAAERLRAPARRMAAQETTPNCQRTSLDNFHCTTENRPTRARAAAAYGVGIRRLAGPSFCILHFAFCNFHFAFVLPTTAGQLSMRRRPLLPVGSLPQGAGRTIGADQCSSAVTCSTRLGGNVSASVDQERRQPVYIDRL